MNYNRVLHSFSRALKEQPLKSIVLFSEVNKIVWSVFCNSMWVVCYFSCWSIFNSGKAIIVAWHKLTWRLWPWFSKVSEQLCSNKCNSRAHGSKFQGFAANQSAPRSYRWLVSVQFSRPRQIGRHFCKTIMWLPAHFATLSKWVKSELVLS